MATELPEWLQPGEKADGFAATAVVASARTCRDVPCPVRAGSFIPLFAQWPEARANLF
jgi:hypothetical protein